MTRRAHLLAACLVTCGIAASGCRGTIHVAGDVGRAALWTAATVGEIAILATHDAHIHNDHCGHYRRWHGGHWTYYYGGHWEYYDQGSQRWYYYGQATSSR
ncbi:MAG TPA: hypothetical protein VFG83_02955 [Kofleriaceae bacterium]|nr:hypothetical protein [Kofleriaceae bacterium]